VTATLAPAEQRHGYIGRIPVANLWLLMLYASGFQVQGRANQDSTSPPDSIPELVARNLCRAVESRIHRGLNPGFLPVRRDLNRVRGRIDLLDTECRNLLARGRISCHYEELTVDTPRHRYAGAALEVMSSRVTDSDLRHKCHELLIRLSHAGIQPHRPSDQELLRDPVPRHDREGATLLAACHLAFQLALPMETVGDHPLPQPDREERWIRRLFEDAIAGYCTLHLRDQGYTVRPGARHDWPIAQSTPGIAALLPGMKTDILIHHPGQQRTLIVDTKFTSITTSSLHREQSLKSGHIYQIYAYLRTLPTVTGAQPHAGLLLYPTVEVHMDESTVMDGHPLRFATLDLTADAPTITRRIHELVTWQTDYPATSPNP
jgi:5-methylcytosine-specific restriction enzyme subunit McrC